MTPDPLLNPAALRSFLAQHRLPPLDLFGQHFLVDAEVLARIVAAAEPDAAVPLIEIGAGLGVLTRALALARERQTNGKTEFSAPLVAVERDRRFQPLLVERVRAFPLVTVVTGDILRLAPDDLLPLPGIAPYDVVGNIPYSITARLLRHVLAWLPRPRRITFLMDTAVSSRIAAVPPDANILSVSVQVYAEPRVKPPSIPPAAFLPPPQVSSAIVRLNVRPLPLVPEERAKAFFRLVRAGFSQRRKMLGNALRPLWGCAAQDAARILEHAGIDAKRRAQTLTIAEWLTLLDHAPRFSSTAPPKHTSSHL